jgi:hypothetical protein
MCEWVGRTTGESRGETNQPVCQQRFSSDAGQLIDGFVKLRLLQGSIMKIGIIGTGNMGRVLGGRWALAGHNVFFGARRLEAAQEARALALAGGAEHVDAGGNDDAAAFGECLLYCLRGVDPATVFSNTSVRRDFSLNHQPFHSPKRCGIRRQTPLW